jgi:hypothetical protein
MKFKIVYKKVPDKVVIEKADLINREKFADALGVSAAMANYMLNTGQIHHRHHDKIAALSLMNLIGRKRAVECHKQSKKR